MFYELKPDNFEIMRTEQLDYYLPEELIAQQPSRVRNGSRLLVLNRASGELFDRKFRQIGEFLRAGDCLVINDTKVLPARFYAQRQTGGRLEGLFLIERQKGLWLVMMKSSARLRQGEHIKLKDRGGGDFCTAEVVEKLEQGKCILRVNRMDSFRNVLDHIGFTPLPPYIKRSADVSRDRLDRDRYQTVYAREAGSVAAPTAGLHFTRRLMKELENIGVVFARVTLHVGEGTFRPITSQSLDGHKMHSEWYSVDDKNAEIINEAKEKDGRIIAVGTTSVRVLETVAQHGHIKAGSGYSDLFIKPGYKFKIVDAMITNFHLPRSTLLALVAAFAGLEQILSAYRYAVEKRYRFYSYGDAMLIL